ncbi:magnesium transporter MRS2-5 [Jatropha curcas]|uniref:magnesium transporter MRS2-5 n=1 Tax=Jatropha curcas TaxID=180498 RepID=UPI0018960B79|nr:magnesium transporter MRS2-5 [Jatropha curcas]
MEESRGQHLPSDVQESASPHDSGRLNLDAYVNLGSSLPGLKKRNHGHGSRSWIKIDQNGESMIMELDKGTIMRHCSLPARDLRLLDPLFIYPSTILGREKAIVVGLEQIRCIITADEVILMNSLDACVVQYESEFCKRLQTNKDQAEDLPFEFRALELALELTCISLDAQVKELEMEIYPLLDELASSINTLNLERVRRVKGHLLALTQRVQKVHDEIEHLMDDDGDMAEMYLTEKKQRAEACALGDLFFQNNISGENRVLSKSAPISPVRSVSGVQKLQRTFSSIVTSSKHGSLTSSSSNDEKVDQLEMLLEAYFVAIDNSLSKLFSVRFSHAEFGLEPIPRWSHVLVRHAKKDAVPPKFVCMAAKPQCVCQYDVWAARGNVQNQLIQFELLLTAATFVTTVFAVVTGIFGMNFTASVFDYPSAFNWVLVITGIACGFLYSAFLFYFRHKKVFPL